VSPRKLSPEALAMTAYLSHIDHCEQCRPRFEPAGVSTAKAVMVYTPCSFGERLAEAWEAEQDTTSTTERCSYGGPDTPSSCRLPAGHSGLHERSKKVVESGSTVDELKLSSSGSEWGTMLRLASEVELLKDSDLVSHGHTDLWSYLEKIGFEPTFVEKVAKVYWRAACHIISQIPYHVVVTEAGCASQRRLMVRLLREVCSAMSSAT